jgi:UDP-glucuronate 4-epimerase
MILVTGCAGFIGYHLCKKLISQGRRVVGIDNLNEYYDIKLKIARRDDLPSLEWYLADITTNSEYIEYIINKHKPTTIVHLAAYAGVPYSNTNPFAYEQSNNLGTLTMMELALKHKVENFVYASSSSIYGNNPSPYYEDMIPEPLSVYGATKAYNEMLAYIYSDKGLPCTGLRFFTCYGEWGRPDMAIWKWTKNILEGIPVELNNSGDMWRDFTHIDDTVSGIILAMNKIENNGIYNIGRGETVRIGDVVEMIENETGLQATKNMLPCFSYEPIRTLADIRKAKKLLGYEPKVSIDEGVSRFIKWYKEYNENRDIK